MTDRERLEAWVAANPKVVAEIFMQLEAGMLEVAARRARLRLEAMP